MTLKELELFYYLCDNPHISQLAKKISMSQSAISLAVKSLEKKLSEPLFDRVGKKLILNERGRIFKEKTYRHFLALQEAENFFKKDKKIVVFDITDIADESLSLIEATYKNNNIRVVKEHIGKNFKYEGYPRELLQVFLNILGNAKDILIERDTKEKLVLFRIKENSNSSIIEIYDSAGGIPEDIILKIFDPYFTTKHQSHGTGIGLFMSKEIVQKHLKGDLTASNEEFFIDGKRYYGACFRVSLSTFS